jgi:hypothetical protein
VRDERRTRHDAMPVTFEVLEKGGPDLVGCHAASGYWLRATVKPRRSR